MIGELPNTRETLLLRLLGSARVRAQAIRELRALPDDAWEKQVAQPWLHRLFLELPDPLTLTQGEQTELAMDDYRAWHEEYERNRKAQFKLELEPLIKLEVEREIEAKLMRERTHLFERRLRRPLTAAERETLVARTREYGSDRVGEILVDLSVTDLSEWLAGQSQPE